MFQHQRDRGGVVAGIVASMMTGVVTIAALVAPTVSATGCTAAAYSGAGTIANPIELSTAGHLLQLGATSADWGKHFRQVAPIDLSGCTWTPIGNSTTRFTGSYQGSMFPIVNLTVTGSTNLGLFGYLRDATVSGVALQNVSITATGDNVGALSGSVHASQIEDIVVSGAAITSTGRNIGGVIGFVDHEGASAGYSLSRGTTTIDGVVSGGQVEGTRSVGGVVGRIVAAQYPGPTLVSLNDLQTSVDVSTTGFGEGGGAVGDAVVWSYDYAQPTAVRISDATASGDVSSSYGTASGGLVGSFESDPPGSSITSSLATGDVTVTVDPQGYNDHSAGGLVGVIYDVEISDSGATGDVSGRSRVGGLVGWHRASGSTTISASYATGDVSGRNGVGGLIGIFSGRGSGKTVTLVDTYARGDVSGTENPDEARAAVGGLIGDAQAENGFALMVESSYSTGQVTATGSDIGGLLGFLRSGTILLDRAFWDTETSQIATSPGVAGSAGTGHTTADMTSTAIYTGATWDITGFTAGARVVGSTVWGQCPDSYPFLMWQPDRPSTCPGGSSVLPPPPPPPPASGSPETTTPPETSSPGTTAPTSTTLPSADGAPRPALVDGVLPELQPGEVLVLEGDQEVAPRVFVEDRTELVLEGNTFELRLAGDCSVSACTIDTTPAGRQVLTLEEDGMANVEGLGFLSGTPVHVWLFSEPRYLGQLTVRADGTFEGDLALGDIEPGLHTLQVNGTSFDNKDRSANLGVIVRTAPSGVLPSTGTDTSSLWLVALALMAGGVMIVRRRGAGVDG